MREDHIRKRELPLGRWVPVVFYSANVILWFIIALQARADALIWLVTLPLPALGLYCWRVCRSST